MDKYNVAYVEHYFAVADNEGPTCATMWMAVENMWKKPDAKGHILHDSIYV